MNLSLDKKGVILIIKEDGEAGEYKREVIEHYLNHLWENEF